jgi:tRNA G18 (ribose-2'-O)-methylase SpoU
VAGSRTSAPPNLVRLDSLDDPRLEPYRDVRDRALSSWDVFLAESESVLRVLVRRGHHPLRSLLLLDSRVDKLQNLLELVPPEVPIFVGSQELLDSLTGFHIHRGVLACAERVPVPTLAELLGRFPPGPATLVVLESLTNHDNLGAIFRNAAVLGADGIVLDRRSCDPLYRKSIRVSVGACLVVPYARVESVRPALATLREAGFTTVALTPNEPATDLRDLGAERDERVALLLGSEGPGLEPETMHEADRRARIRQRSDFDSLNVATACGIALHELARR